MYQNYFHYCTISFSGAFFFISEPTSSCFCFKKQAYSLKINEQPNNYLVYVHFLRKQLQRSLAGSTTMSAHYELSKTVLYMYQVHIVVSVRYFCLPFLSSQ